MADWLFSSGNCTFPHNFEHGQSVDFRRGPVRSFLEETPVLPGIWLYRGEATSSSRFRIEVDGGDPGTGRIILGSILSSSGVMTLEGCGDHGWRDEGRFYMLSPIQRRVCYEIDARNGWRTVALRLEAEALETLGGDGLPALVREVLEARRDDVVDMAPLGGVLRSLSHLLLHTPYEGGMQRLFRQAKALELLTHQLDLFEGDTGEQSLSASEVRRVRLARERLLADLRDPPDLASLAQEVGLSPKRLNRGFRMLYGTTVFNYLRDARLDAARAALEGGSPLPLKQLAWELGYGQVTNFVTAFRRRFGVPPGAYRAGGGSARRH